MGNPETDRPPEEAADFTFPPEGQVEFEESEEQPIEAPSTKEQQEHEKSFFERLRSYPPLRPIVLGFALEAAALGWHAKGNAQELQRMEQTHRVNNETPELKEKHKLLVDLYGQYLPHTLDIDRQIEKGGREQNDIKERVIPKVSDFSLKAEDGTDYVVPHDAVTIILKDMYPKGWAVEEISAVEQTNDDLGPSKTKLGKKVAEFKPGSAGAEGRIVFYKKADMNEYDFRSTLAHELGHANDWESDNDMTREERMDLLLAISERLKADNHERSVYVDLLSFPTDEKAERYVKASEYWAEICSEYFVHPKWMQYADFKIVDQQVRKLDPKFDPEEAHWKQFELIWGNNEEAT